MNTEILNIIAPIFLIAGLGYAMEATGRGFHPGSLTRLVMWIGTPSLVFSSLTRTELPTDDLLRMAGCAVAVVLIGGGVAAAILRALRLPLRAYLPPLTLPNSGNAGLPVVLFAFSQDGLSIGVAFFFVIALTQYVVVPIFIVGRANWRAIATEPLLWSVMTSIAVKFLEIVPPAIIAETTHILGGMVIPVMLLMLGGALARLRVADLFTSAFLAVVRLAVGAGAGMVVILVFNLDGVEAATLFLLSAMPAAVVTYVFAERYGQAPEEVAGLVVCSTILTFLTLPILLIFAFKIAQ